MARVSRRNSALKYFVNGRRAQQLDGLTDLAGNVLNAYDTAVTRAVVGLKRRVVPSVRRVVRSEYGVKAGALSGKYRLEAGTAGRRGDRSDYISVWASTRPTPLLEFGGRWTGPRSAGATAAITLGKRKTYDSAFIATVRGRRAIRVRSRLSTGRRAGRGPLRMLYGPSSHEMLAGTGHAPSLKAQRAVLAELTEFYTAELRRQFQLQKS